MPFPAFSSGAATTPQDVARDHARALQVVGPLLGATLERLVEALAACGLSPRGVPWRDDILAETGLAARALWNARLVEPASGVLLELQLELHTMPTRLASSAQRLAVRLVQGALMQCDATLLEQELVWAAHDTFVGGPNVQWMQDKLESDVLLDELKARVASVLQP